MSDNGVSKKCTRIILTKIDNVHVNIIMLHVDINKSHVNIIMLHIDIIYLACRGQKYATIRTNSVDGTVSVNQNISLLF